MFVISETENRGPGGKNDLPKVTQPGGGTAGLRTWVF